MRRAAVAAVGFALLGGTPLPAAEPFPYDLTVLVRSDAAVGRERLREEAERLLNWEIAGAGCFREVRSALPDEPDGDDLAFRLTLVGIEEETRWDLSIAQRSDPRQTPDAVNTSQTVRLRADLVLELMTVAGDRVLRSKSVRVVKAYRPRYNEDPRLEARQLLIDETATLARRWVCKGTARALQKEFRRSTARDPERSEAD